MPKFKETMFDKKGKKEFNQHKTFVKPYILESRTINKINKYIDENYKDKEFNSLNSYELKLAVKNKILDLTDKELEKYSELPPHSLYNQIINNLSKKYYEE